MLTKKFTKVKATPIYEQVAAHIRERAETGEWKLDNRLPPEPILARDLDVSRGTLRKALRILERQTVIVQRKGKGTFVSLHMENAVPRKRIAITGQLPGADHNDPYWSRVLNGIQEGLGEESGVELLYLPGCDDPFSGIRVNNLHGVFLSPDETVARKIAGPALNRIPHVIFSASFDVFRENDNVMVGTDNFGSAMKAMKYLLDLGHRRIAYVTWGLHRCTMQDQLRAFQGALKKAGIPWDERLVVSQLCDIAPRGAMDAILRRLLAEQRPTAIVCSGLTTIYPNVMRVLKELGLQMPRDVSLVTFDDSGLGVFASPSVTGVVQHTVEMGRKAGEMMLCQLRGKPLAQRQVILESDFVVRESSTVSCAPEMASGPA